MVGHLPKGNLRQQFDIVAIYDVPDDAAVDPASYLEVTQMIRDGEREKFFMKDLLEAIDPATARPEMQGSYRMLNGTHASGFRMTSVLSQNNGVATFLPLVEDTQSGRLLVVGPRAIEGSENWPNVTYVNGTDPDRGKAIAAINDFVIAGAKTRGEQDTLDVKGAETLVQDMVRAAFVMGGIKEYSTGERTHRAPAEATIGQFLVEIAAGNADMVAYTLTDRKPDAPKL